MSREDMSAAKLWDMPPTATDLPVLQREKHISYWLRCLRTPLPHQYTSNDSNRVSLAFFTLSALDLLGALDEKTTAEERAEYADWIYSCQHSKGGFRSYPAMNFGDRANASNAVWDPANIPATFFALGALAVLKDDFSRVKRHECLKWLSRMQRPDGSFGEMLGENDRIEGGMDTRFGHCASGIRWMLTGESRSKTTTGVPDIDVDGLIRCIDSFKSYDGGISQGAFNESHAGLTYCAIGALSFLGRLPKKTSGAMASSYSDVMVKWLMYRLTAEIEEDESDEEDENENDSQHPHQTVDGPSQDELTSFEKFSSRPLEQAQTKNMGVSSKDPSHECLSPIDILSINWVGLNGRSNKLADTCYVFWAGASLAMLDSLHLTPVVLVRNYLLEKTQHLVMGGFGKLPGALPDLYHAYLGLAALSLLGSAERNSPESPAQVLKPLDPALCVSVEAREWIKSLPWRNG